MLTPARWLAAAAIAGALLAHPGAAAHAQPFSPYHEFQALSLAQLRDLDLKLTYVGSQLAPIQTRMLQARGAAGAGQFAAFRRPNVRYENDTLEIAVATVTVEELDAVLDSVATLPGVTDGDVDAGGFLSFALRDTAGGIRGFESIVDAANGAALLARMRGALEGNTRARHLLEAMACDLDLASGEAPEDVTPSVQIEMSGVHLVRDSGRFAGFVRITNVGGVPLEAPLTLAVATAPNVRLLDPYGRSCRVSPVGARYVVLDVGGALAPGAFVERRLEFANPDLDPIGATFAVHSGTGAR